jgi:hypothetical protein
MDNVGIVVDDLGETIDFFRELGRELEGRPRSKENGQILTRLSSRITAFREQRNRKLA